MYQVKVLFAYLGYLQMFYLFVLVKPGPHLVAGITLVAGVAGLPEWLGLLELIDV